MGHNYTTDLVQLNLDWTLLYWLLYWLRGPKVCLNLIGILYNIINRKKNKLWNPTTDFDLIKITNSLSAIYDSEIKCKNLEDEPWTKWEAADYEFLPPR